MITSIIFSKDRPLQLDLCLSTLKNNFIDCDDVYVIENYSDTYRPSLANISNDHQNINVIKQSVSLYNDVLSICDKAKNKYICFLTDDDIVYRKFSIAGYDVIFNEYNAVCCISLRLGLNINTRWHLGNQLNDHIVSYYDLVNFICVPKTTHKYGSYWSYSHSLDGHIFRKTDIQNMLLEISILDRHIGYKQTPNELEAQMQKYWTNSYNMMVCPKHSVVLNSPNNRVSTSHQDNMSGEKYKYDASDLYYLYMLGNRIDINKLDFNDVNCPHTEIDLMKGVL